MLAFVPASVDAPEGSTAKLTVTRTGGLGVGSSVHFATQDGTAKAGRDYQPAHGTLSFAPGQSRRTIAVKVLSGKANKSAESFTVRLTSPSHATLGKATATVIIAGNQVPNSNLASPPSHAKPGHLHNFHGTATDPDGNLSAVAVSVFSAHPVNGHCLSIKPGGGTARGPGGRCEPRIFIQAAGTNQCSLHLRRGLPRGTWIVVSRAFDTTGLSETSFSRADHNLAVISVG